MSQISSLIILAFGFLALISFLLGYYQSIIKKNPFQETPSLLIFGIFVWGDAVVLGLLWLLVSLVTFLLNDWTLFLLFISVFWTVRSSGEVIYWLNQQFSPLNRNPPERLKGYCIFGNESIWFVYQLVWQCILVVSSITSVFLTNFWINSKF